MKAKRRPFWPPKFPDLETPAWLYAPTEGYPPDVIAQMERKRQEDEEENS